MSEDEKPKEPGFLETIKELQLRDPFQPFRIVVASGDKYPIESPVMFVVGETQMYYCFPHSDRWLFIRNNQIVAIENHDVRQSA